MEEVKGLTDDEINKIIDDYCYFVSGYSEAEFRTLEKSGKIKCTSSRPLTDADIDILIRTLKGNLAKFRAAPVIFETEHRQRTVDMCKDLISYTLLDMGIGDEENRKKMGENSEPHNKFLSMALLELLDILITIGSKYSKPSFWDRFTRGKVSVGKMFEAEIGNKS